MEIKQVKGNEVVVAASINDSSKDRFVVTVTVAGWPEEKCSVVVR